MSISMRCIYIYFKCRDKIVLLHRNNFVAIVVTSFLIIKYLPQKNPASDCTECSIMQEYTLTSLLMLSLRHFSKGGEHKKKNNKKPEKVSYQIKLYVS